MKLIDSDKLLQDLKNMGTETDNIGRYIDMMMLYECQNVVKNQPAAFDVEKVIEQLENYRDKSLGYAINDSWKYGACHAIDKAIEIIKRGGTDEEN